MKELTFERVKELVAGQGVALRVRQRLQPAGGPGTKVFPPTYAVEITRDNLNKYAMETRRIDGVDKKSVLLDSVASQANRMEEALQAAWEAGALAFPVISVDFSQDPALVDLGKVTTLQAPHRIADAILRDSTGEDGKTLFRDLPAGKAYTDARPNHATAVYRYCPTALLFGVWDSTGPKGGLGAKFARALTSEIVGVGAEVGAKVSSRLDPLAIQANVPLYHDADDPNDWTIEEDKAKKDKGKAVPFNRRGGEGKGKPSAVNHSNIAPTIDETAGGVTFDYAEQTVVLSLPALRRLKFPTGYDGKALAQREAAEVAAHTALAALGIAAIVHLREQGYDLRSRALLVPEGDFVLQAVLPNGATEDYSISAAVANALVAQASQAAAALGLAWEREPVKLRPAAKLAALVKKSREEAAAGGGEE